MVAGWPATPDHRGPPSAMAGHAPVMRKIDRDSRTPPWRQIADVLRADILAGRYSPDGPAVPSASELSAEWRVAKRTALKALRSLAAEGLIEVENGMGYYVTRR